MKIIGNNENATKCLRTIKRVIVFFVFLIILIANTKNVSAEENYYWPTPTVTDLSRGYSDSHKAIDIAAPEGTDIYATKSGTVIGVGNACSCIGNYPNCNHKFYAGSGYETGVGTGVMIKHDDGSGYSIYAHMTASSWPENVYEGAHVNQGQFIGKTGNSGNSTGPHLHFVIMDNSATNWWNCTKINNNVDKISYVYDYIEVEIVDNTRVIDAGAAEITDTTAKIKATISPYGTVTECGFFWGTSPDNMEKVVESGTVEDCASIFYTLGTGKWTAALSKGTTYYYQIYGIIGGVTYKTSIGSFTTTGDSVQPVIESVTITDLTSEGYTVEVVATDNVGIAKVCCPTWTDANGQDDLIQNWETNTIATCVSGNTYTYRINISEHNNERGSYVTHVYAYDMSGNAVFKDLLVEVPEPTVSVTGVSLNNSSLSLEVDGTSTLTATVSPSNATNKTVTWTSSNTGVATVTNGVVKAIAPGTATITVKTADGNKTAICTVTVKAKTVSVSSVALNKTSVSLTVDETETLTATLSPSNAINKTVTWTSSNTSVATVNNGVVTAVAPGTATITVKTVDGSKTATCTVTVKAKTVSVSSVVLNKTSVSLTVDDAETLTATVSPSNATNKTVTWTSSNTSVATVNNGVVTAVAPGTAAITVTTADGGHTATCSVTVKDAVADADAPKIVVSNVQGTAGETVTVTVSLENNPGFAGLNTYLTYSDSLTLLEATNSTDLTFTNDATMVWDGVADYEADGELLKLVFTISEDAEVGEHFVKIHFVEAYTAELEDVTFTTVDGNVEVIDFVYGDANGDGVVNTKDIILLRRHVAAKDPTTGESTIEVNFGADANGDGEINTKDIILVRRHVAAKDPETGESSIVLGPNN